MTFASNILRLEHTDGFGIEFTCIDALRCLSSENYIPKVAAAQAWREARPLADYSKEDEDHFDWTFTTDYKGTLFGNDKTIVVCQKACLVTAIAFFLLIKKCHTF